MSTVCTMIEAAERLHVSHRTVRRLVARGDLDSVNVGAQKRVTVASVDAMLRPHGASRTAARICTPEEVEETERFLTGLLAKVRAERAAMTKKPKEGAVATSARPPYVCG